MITQAQAIKTNEWALLVLLSLLWGGAFIAAGLAVEELPPLTVVLARVGLAVAVLLPLFWFQGHSMPRTFAEWVPFLGMGLLNNVLPFGFFFAGLTFISVSLTSIINALTPLFTILVMACFRQEPLTLPRLTGVLLGALGVSFIQGFDGGTDSTQAIGILLCLCGACSYGFAALWGRYYLQGVAPLKSATCQLVSSMALLIIIVAIIDQPWTLAMPGPSTIWALVALGVLGTALAYIVFFEILVRAGASNVMLVTLLIPVTAIGFSYLFFDEVVRPKEIVGALIIGAGLLLIDGRVLGFFRTSRR